jgi:hypothetical protein
MKKLIAVHVLILMMSSLAQAMCLSFEEGVRRGCARDLSQSCGAKEYAFHDKSCLADGKGEIIPDLLRLQKGQLVHPDYYRLYEVNDIARTLIYRHYLLNEMPSIREQDVQNPSFDFYGDAEIQIAFKSERIQDIAKNGFLNQHQVNHTNGCACTTERAVTEDAIIGLKLEAAYNGDDNSDVNKLRPKYSYFVPAKPIKSETHRYTTNYGDVIAVLNNSLKKRMTFTNGDSLGRSEDTARRVHTTSYLAASLDFNEAKSYYYEAQIWGTVAVKDISKILLGCFGGSAMQKAEQISNEFPNVPLYSCETVQSQGLNVFVAKDKISIGKVIIVSANYNGVDITDTLKKLCDKKSSCAFNSTALSGQAKQADSDSTDISYMCVQRNAENNHAIKITKFANRASFDFNCMNEKAPAYKIPQKIKVKSATFGGNIAGVKAGNVTDKAAQFCDGKDSCDYKVAVKFLGDPAPKQKKSFKLTYECVPQKDSTDGKTFSLDAESAEGTVLNLKCPIEAKK